MGLLHGVAAWVDAGQHTVNSTLLASLKALVEDNS